MINYQSDWIEDEYELEELERDKLNDQEEKEDV